MYCVCSYEYAHVRTVDGEDELLAFASAAPLVRVGRARVIAILHLTARCIRQSVAAFAYHVVGTLEHM